MDVRYTPLGRLERVETITGRRDTDEFTDPSRFIPAVHVIKKKSNYGSAAL
jgi:hypothetical protein